MEHVGYGEWRTSAKETGMDAKKLDCFLLELASDLNILIQTSDTNLQAALSCSLASGLLLLSPGRNPWGSFHVTAYSSFWRNSGISLLRRDFCTTRCLCEPRTSSGPIRTAT